MCGTATDEQGDEASDVGRPLDGAMAGHRSDRRRPVELDGHQLGHVVEVDQRGGAGEAHGQERDQALATREDLRVFPVLGEGRDRLGKRTGSLVEKGRRLHATLNGIFAMPRSEMRGAHSGSPAYSIVGKRRTNRPIATWASRRARDAPRQKWMPDPSAR